MGFSFTDYLTGKRLSLALFAEGKLQSPEADDYLFASLAAPVCFGR
jgi:hypothetical protein